MSDKEKYKPVSCTFMDEVENLATLRKSGRIEKGRIVYRNNGDVITVEDAILTWESRNGAEYLLLEGGLEIRMDYVVSIYEVRANSADK
ncbi:MAG: hypothetical protein GC193_02565 [Cryomorphaceae bacterium]|nr:hypothetical protein [Cryomorphaceae bacterium]